jgi:regulation of enolase protein 1 (concanavalin A-like superfamily)
METMLNEAAFAALCENANGATRSEFTHWRLEPVLSGPSASPGEFTRCALRERFRTQPGSGWSWYDPLADCALAVEDSLEIRAGPGRDLWYLNRSAPRLVRPVEGDFAVQVLCGRARDDHPAIGGLLLWKNGDDFLRLDLGTRGPHEVSFAGYREGRGLVIGRGRLPGARVLLRLERRAERVRAFCSTDGDAWLTAGETAFPVADPVGVGLFAIGAVDCTIYPDTFPHGATVRFEAFTLWQ